MSVPTDTRLLIRSSTHMPSVIEVRGVAYLLFSRLEMPSRWGSYYAPLDNLVAATRLKTETAFSECSPDGYVDSEQKVNVSITQDYRLVRYRGASFDDLAVAQDYGPCRAGTVLPSGDYILCADRDQPILIHDGSGVVVQVILPEQLKLRPHTLISRITFLPEDPDKIVITGVSQYTDISLLFSRSMGRAWTITTMGQPVYKCTIYRGELFYAVRGGSWFDDRYLARTRALELTPI